MPDVLLGLIWVQIVCKGKVKSKTSKLRVNDDNSSKLES